MAAGCTVEVPFFFLAGHWLINKLQVLTFKKDRNFIKDFNSTIKKLFSKWAHNRVLHQVDCLGVLGTQL